MSQAPPEPHDAVADGGLPDAGRPEHWFDRFSMLSDGVFAIAITLLAFDVHGPEAWDGTLASLWATLAPQLDAFALSFVVISVYWLAHRRFVATLTAVDAPVTVINLVLLALIALLPSATRLAESRHGAGPDMLVYGALVVAIGMTLSVMWGYAGLIAGLVDARLPRRVRWFLLALMVFTPAFFLGLTELIPHPVPGVVPGVLIVLFIVGWRMRLWTLARLMAMHREPEKPPPP
jgi:uncharacterized membrane protein